MTNPISPRVHETVCLLALILGGDAFVPPAVADDSAPRTAYAERIHPLLAKYCFECHGEKVAKGKLRLDTLSADFKTAQAATVWKTIGERVAATDEDVMPPKEKPRPTAAELDSLRAWIDSGVKAHAAAETASQKAEGRAQLRRLNRLEYNNTLRDLLGIELDLKPLLPEDDSIAGFDNVGTGLQITRIHQERYLEAAEKALDAAIVTGPQPKSTSRRFTFRKDGYPPRQMLENDAIVFFTSATAELQAARAPVAGHYRVRISTRPYRTDNKPLVVHVNCGNPNHPDERYLAVPAGDKSTVLEFTAHFGSGNTVRIAPQGFGVKYIKDPGTYDGPGLVIDWVEMDGPLTDVWPPESHRRLLGDVDLKKATAADAERVLRSFIPRAFRRPAEEGKVQKFVAFMHARIADGAKVEDALRQALVAVLCAPNFLMLYEKPGALDEFAVASRLSYFLWRSMPDQPLLDLAAAKKLRSPDELRGQVDRMLKDPKAASLAENFLGQWLGLRDIDATTPDRILYPEFDEYLKYSMHREPLRFFEEVLAKDLPIQSFLDADFSMLNDRLASHYGIPGVDGPEFRRVKLPREAHRGGVLTMAGILKVTANGTVTSPVLRGAWLHDRILGQPLQLPADLTVSGVEPDIRGAVNIRDQLAKHRTVEQCASCHRKMDPLGFALEGFDPIGGYRTNYRAVGKYPKAKVAVHGKPVEYSDGLPVQVGDVLPNGKAFKDSDEFKARLLEDPERFIRTVAEKLIVYATGAPVRSSDKVAVDRLVTQVRQNKDGLRTLVYELVQSDLFLNK